MIHHGADSKQADEALSVLNNIDSSLAIASAWISTNGAAATASAAFMQKCREVEIEVPKMLEIVKGKKLKMQEYFGSSKMKTLALSVQARCGELAPLVHISEESPQACAHASQFCSHSSSVFLTLFLLR